MDNFEEKDEPFIQKLWANFWEDPIMKVLIIAFLLNLEFYNRGKQTSIEVIGLGVAVILTPIIATGLEYLDKQK